MPDVFIENEQTPNLSDVERAARDLDAGRLADLAAFATQLLEEQEASK